MRFSTRQLGNGPHTPTAYPTPIDITPLLGLEADALENPRLRGGRIEGTVSELDILGINEMFGATYDYKGEPKILNRVFLLRSWDPEPGEKVFGYLEGYSARMWIELELQNHGESFPILLPELPYPIFEQQAVQLDDGRILIGGGFTGVANNNVIAPFPAGPPLIYDPTEKIWAVTEPPKRSAFMYSILKLNDGKVIAVGVGSSDEEIAGAASLFDPEDGSWKELPDKPTLSALPKLALLKDGRVMATGGRDIEGLPGAPSGAEASAVEIFDAETLAWEAAAPLPPGFFISDEDPPLITLTDGRVLAMGTRTEGKYDDPHAEVYDPATNSWKSLNGLDPYYRMVDAVALADGRVLVTGRSPNHGSAPEGASTPTVRI